MSKFTEGTIKPTSLLTHIKPTEGKLIVFSVIGMISAFAVLIIFVGGGGVRHVPITFEERIETTVAFRTIDSEIKIVGLKGTMQTNPTLVSRSGDDTVYASIGIGVILIIGGYLIYRKSESASKWGVVILVLSIVGLFGMRGFFVGPIFGIIGGILALTKR